MQEVIRLQHGFNFLSLIQWLYQYRTTRWMLLCAMEVYEHVPQASRMMDEGYQVLKENGFCYFSAADKYMVMEGHYHLPFLSWIPKRLAHFYLYPWIPTYIWVLTKK